MPAAYSVTALELKGLANRHFSIKSVAGDIRFDVRACDRGWPRAGLEAYGLLVDCHHPVKGTIPSFLKVFKQDVIERAKRTQFLIQLGLSKRHQWMFAAVPYAAVHLLAVGGVRI